MARKTRRRSRSRKQRGGNPEEVEKAEAEVEVESVDNEMTGGAKRKKGRKSRRKTHKGKKGKKGKKKSRKKRKLNPFFKLMLAAKKKGAASFKYNGHTYKGKKHPRLGMIYKKA